MTPIPAFRLTKEQTHERVGLLCFSTAWSNPVLWSHYADKHRGMCPGFDVADHMLTPVTYVDRPMKVPFKGKEAEMTVPDEFFDALIRTKFQDWKYEDEVRVFVQIDHKTEEAGLYFYQLSEEPQLREVILGPRCQLPLGSIRGLVAKHDPKVFVVKSRLAFKNFKVVEHRIATRARR